MFVQYIIIRNPILILIEWKVLILVAGSVPSRLLIEKLTLTTLDKVMF